MYDDISFFAGGPIMVYQVGLLKGILQPYRSRYQLQNAEAVTKFGSRPR